MTALRGGAGVDAVDVMGRQMVGHDDVAGMERGCQDRVDVRAGRSRRCGPMPRRPAALNHVLSVPPQLRLLVAVAP